MSTPDPLPEYIYKIHTADAASLTSVSELDRKSGYIHLSTATQVQLKLLSVNPQLSYLTTHRLESYQYDTNLHLKVRKVAGLSFSKEKELWLQKIPFEKVKDKIKWEEADRSVFPHLYVDELQGAIVGVAGQVEVLVWKRDEDQTWDEASKGFGGLV